MTGALTRASAFALADPAPWSSAEATVNNESSATWPPVSPSPALATIPTSAVAIALPAASVMRHGLDQGLSEDRHIPRGRGRA